MDDTSSRRGQASSQPMIPDHNRSSELYHTYIRRWIVYLGKYSFQLKGSLCIRVYSPVRGSVIIFFFNLMRFWAVVFMRFFDRVTFFLGTANQRASDRAPPHPVESGTVSAAWDAGISKGCNWNSDACRKGELMYKSR